MTGSTEPRLPSEPEVSDPTRQQAINLIARQANQYGITLDEIAAAIATSEHSSGLEPESVDVANTPEEAAMPDGETLPETPEASDTPESLTARIVGGITRARMSVFQAYDVVAERQEEALKAFSIRDSDQSDLYYHPTMEKDDLVDPAHDPQHRAYPVAVQNSLQDYFGVPPGDGHGRIRGEEGTFYVAAAKKRDGTPIIQGAGFLARDAGGQLVHSAFKIAFDGEVSFNLFRDWLVENPSAALHNVFGMALGEDFSPNPRRQGFDRNNRAGILSYSDMSRAIPPTEGHFAFLGDRPRNAQPEELFTRTY